MSPPKRRRLKQGAHGPIAPEHALEDIVEYSPNIWMAYDALAKWEVERAIATKQLDKEILEAVLSAPSAEVAYRLLRTWQATKKDVSGPVKGMIIIQ